ncbi:MAG: YceD family protein [Pseudomonadota bacterium]|jgi:uncharacterized protein
MNRPPTAPGLPRTVAARKLAAKGQRLSGWIDAGALPRLSAAVLGADSRCEAELRFSLGDSGVAEIHGRIEARVTLTCERCLEPFELPLSAAPALGLVGSEADADRLPHRLEPCMVADEELDLFDLVEEELLLALPIIAAHAEESCRRQWIEPAAAEDGIESPFGVLAQLKPRR